MLKACLATTKIGYKILIFFCPVMCWTNKIIKMFKEVTLTRIPSCALIKTISIVSGFF